MAKRSNFFWGEFLFITCSQPVRNLSISDRLVQKGWGYEQLSTSYEQLFLSPSSPRPINISTDTEEEEIYLYIRSILSVCGRKIAALEVFP